MRKLRLICVAISSLLTTTTVAGCQTAEPLAVATLSLETATPESQNLDPRALDKLSADLASTGSGDIHNSLLVVRNGFLVYERYFHGASADDLHTMYSVTKSITSLLIGIALDQGLIESVDTQLPDLFPEYQPMQNPANDKADMTLRHILQMRTGIDWDEHGEPYTRESNPTTALARSADWMRFMLDRPLSSRPGTFFRYNSGATMLLAGVIKNRTGMSAHAFAEKHLFGKLGITAHRWDAGRPDDISNTGWGSHLRPIDMARIGLLVLNDGNWQGEQIVSKAWIAASQERHTAMGGGRGYGYQWWIAPSITVGGTTYDAFYAAGWGGQKIIIVPRVAMVVVVTGKNFVNSSWSLQELLTRVYGSLQK